MNRDIELYMSGKLKTLDDIEKYGLTDDSTYSDFIIKFVKETLKSHPYFTFRHWDGYDVVESRNIYLISSIDPKTIRLSMFNLPRIIEIHFNEKIKSFDVHFFDDYESAKLFSELCEV